MECFEKPHSSVVSLELGNCIFECLSEITWLVAGDEHLAVFRVSKLENVEAASNPGPSEDEVETVFPTENTKSIWVEIHAGYLCKISIYIYIVRDQINAIFWLEI